jgi:glutamine synthetase adenylyltransferase
MHKTDAGEKRKALQREALELAKDAKATMRAAKTLPKASQKARKLQKEADKVLAESKALKDQARLEDLHVWVMEKTKTTKKGSQSYRYWMATWNAKCPPRELRQDRCQGRTAEGQEDEG